MKAQFLSKFPNIRLLRNYLDKHKVKEQEYVIERTVMLKKEVLIHLREHLLENNYHIIKHKNEMFVDDNGVWHVVMYYSLSCDIMLLVNSEGFDYARYVAIKTNGGEQVEKRFTIKNRYKK